MHHAVLSHVEQVDPPRCGMDETTCAVAATFRTVVYVSCNPETLVRDLERIAASLPPNALSIEKFAVFDQFPYHRQQWPPSAALTPCRR